MPAQGGLQEAGTTSSSRRVALRVQQPGFSAKRFLARQIPRAGAQDEGRGDPGLEQRQGACSIRLALQAQPKSPQLPRLGPTSRWPIHLQPAASDWGSAPAAAQPPAGRHRSGPGRPDRRRPARSNPLSPSPPPGPAGLDAMAAIAERIATGAAAAAHQNRSRLIQPQLIGHAPAAEVSAIAEPAVLAAATATQLVHAGRQVQRLRARGGGCWLRHG